MMRPIRSIRPLVISVAVTSALLISLTGCSGAPTTQETATPKVVSSLPPASDADIPALNWALPTGEPSTLDPVQAISYPNLTVVSQMCDTLMRLSPDMTIEDNLVSAEQIDPLTLHLTLIADATFWDGSPVTTEDIAYSLQRASRPEAGVGFLFARVSSIEALDDTTVEVKFSAPDALIIDELASPAAFVMQKAYAETQGEDFGTSTGGVMCSGPFEFESWEPGSSISLVRNDDYWDAAYRAHAEGVNFSFLTDSVALAQALNSGEIDGAYEVPPTLIPALQRGGAGTVSYGPSLQSVALSVSHPGGVIGDIRLRQAIYKSIDREALIGTVYHGAASPNYTSVASQVWDKGAEEIWQAAYGQWEEASSFDIEAAKKLVEESDYNGEELVISILAGEDTQSRVAQLIQQQAKEIGVDIQINAVQPAEYALMAYDAAAREGTDLYLSSSFNGSPGTLEYIQFVLADQGYYNYSEFSDEEAFAKVETARETFDVKERAKLLVEAQDAYEAEFGGQSIFNLFEVSFLADGLTGATTSFAYLFTPSLALIGAK